MSKALRERRLMAPPVGILTIALLLVVALAGSRFGQTRAQDATPAAGGECVSASADAEPMSEGTPEATPAATPVDATGAEAAIAAANAYVECHNASADAGLQISNLEADTESAATYDDGHTSINVTYMLGEYQYVAATWFFHMDGSELMFAEEDLGGIAPEGDTVVKSASVPEGETSVAFGQGGNVTESEVITIHISNAAAEPATYNLYAIPAAEGAATPVAGEEMATPTSDEAMASGELVGTLTIPAGGEEDMYLLGLPAGTYALVDANVAGSVATLTVASLGI
jgi:hypothetical protein